MARPATAIAVLAVVLLHALLVMGRTVASVISLASFVATHPGISSTPMLLVSSASGVLFGLVDATGDVVLGLWFFRRAPRARVVLSVWLGLSGLLTLGGVLSWLAAAVDPSILVATLSLLQLALCVTALVLLWLPQTTAWLRRSSVSPAGPDLERRAP